MAFVVVDYRKGNIRSVQKGLELAGADARVSEDPKSISQADAIVLPGVGSFADAANHMTESGQMQVIRERIAEGVPFLGICLGLHLLLERGQEGAGRIDSGDADHEAWIDGIGVIPGYVRRIDSLDAKGKTYKVPHVGWNQVCFKDEDDEGLRILFRGIGDGSNFYFTHSYQGVALDEKHVLATVTHATAFPAVLRKASAFGVQFHPEKSSNKGLMVLKNFVEFAKKV